MYLLYKCKDYDGDISYNAKCIIGIYENYERARNDLISKLNSLKYEYDIEIDDGEYCFIKIERIKGIELTTTPIPCFEIIKFRNQLNKIKMK